jgi:hypothetical protein
MRSPIKRKGQKLVSLGLLMVVTPFLLKDFFVISDFFYGFLVGSGIVLEITGIIFMKKSEGNNCSSDKLSNS